MYNPDEAHDEAKRRVPRLIYWVYIRPARWLQLSMQGRSSFLRTTLITVVLMVIGLMGIVASGWLPLIFPLIALQLYLFLLMMTAEHFEKPSGKLNWYWRWVDSQ